IFDQHAAYKGELIGVQTKRGCPYSCQFCLYTYIEGKKVRYRRPENIVDEISQFYHQWAVKKFWFSDAQFIPGMDAIPVCKELLERLVLSKMDISWSGYIRASLIDGELARLMVRTGIGDLEVSITSGSQREIDALKMGFKIDELMEGLRNLKEAGFKGRLLLNYSLNSPDADIDTLKESIASYKKISEMMGADMVFPFIFFYGIQPNTGFEKRLIESGYIPRGYNPLSLNPFTVRKLLYNPPPLDKLIAKVLLSAWEDGGQDVGKDVFRHLEDEIQKVG
ncbi:MAG: radical SAM protein, partial [Nitrospirota bacterium]